MNIYEGRDVSLATNHSILALIWVQKFLTEFHHCGIGATIKMWDHLMPWRRFAFSECF